MAADCSTPARQPQETYGHRGWTNELTAPATSVSQQSVDGDERRFGMSAAGFLLDTPVLCHAHNDTPEHTTGTGFAPVRVTSAVPGAVESCVPMSDASRQHHWDITVYDTATLKVLSGVLRLVQIAGSALLFCSLKSQCNHVSQSVHYILRV